MTAIIALGLLAAAPVPVTTPPIIAVSCRGGVTSIELTEHAAYDATFYNTTSVAADDIHVAIPYGRRRVATFDVAHAFPAHADVAVHLHKNLSGGLFAYSSDENACNVRYVHFVNGTSWGDPRPDG
ncbi:MAG TPA: hypothetical protein VMG98_13050 [Verrucomicrobiae bacterium]|nr:hypothetical protein [Verrucomicrobiae bacterium]